MRYGPKSAGANDYRALAKEVIAMEEPAAPAVPLPDAQRVEVNRVEVSVNLDASKLAGAKHPDDEVAA
jgi:hypothetical protein